MDTPILCAERSQLPVFLQAWPRHTLPAPQVSPPALSQSPCLESVPLPRDSPPASRQSPCLETVPLPRVSPPASHLVMLSQLYTGCISWDSLLPAHNMSSFLYVTHALGPSWRLTMHGFIKTDSEKRLPFSITFSYQIKLIKGLWM